MEKDLAAAPPSPYGHLIQWLRTDVAHHRMRGADTLADHCEAAADALDQMRTAIAAERARTADTHAAYCHSQQQFHDAVAELSTLRQQLERTRPAPLSDEQINEAQEAAYQALCREGYTGGMGSETWDLASARAVIAEYERLNGIAPQEPTP